MTGPATPLDWASAYARRGWSVIVLRPRDKRPLIPWTQFQRRHASAPLLAEWFDAHADRNVGVVTGAISGLLVLDVDPGHGGAASLDRLTQRNGPLPAAPEAATGGGGRHLYFAHPDGRVANRAGLADGIDLRGDGGYVVAPPSVHPSGRPYRWLAGRSPDEIEPPPTPHWLLELAAAASPARGHPREHWRRLAREGVEEGRRNSTIASFAGHLLWHGVDAEVVLELLLAWNRWRCRPPLTDAEVADVVASIGRLHDREDETPA